MYVRASYASPNLGLIITEAFVRGRLSAEMALESVL